jgi:hypothetical protein
MNKEIGALSCNWYKVKKYIMMQGQKNIKILMLVMFTKYKHTNFKISLC